VNIANVYLEIVDYCSYQVLKKCLGIRWSCKNVRLTELMVQFDMLKILQNPVGFSLQPIQNHICSLFFCILGCNVLMFTCMEI